MTDELPTTCADCDLALELIELRRTGRCARCNERRGTRVAIAPRPDYFEAYAAGTQRMAARMAERARSAT